MKNILLLVHDDDGQEARLQTALDLTRALHGHLTCVDVTVLPMMMADFAGGAEQALLVVEEKEREAKHRTIIADRLEGENVPWDWVDVTGDMVSALLDQSMLADLIVLNRKLGETDYPDMYGVTSRVVTEARVPVVAVPQDQKGFGTERALIAWDGGASCAAAMRAAVPLLQLASQVCIFSAVDRWEEFALEAPAAYLSRHGIHATTRVMERGKAAADELISAECRDWRADYVVMGAYGRGRLREVFGGVTKRMLNMSSIPMVLAH